MRRVPATEGSSKSVASDVSASSRADMDSAGHDEGYAAFLISSK